MNRKLLLYHTSVFGAAAACAIALYLRDPHVTSTELFAVLLLSVLATIAELLAFVLPNSARGSIAFIPYLASALVVPSWPTIVGVVVVKALVEAARKSRLRMTLLNIALHVLAVGGAIWIFTLLRGHSLLDGRSDSLLAATVSSGIPALLAMAFAIFANTIGACWYLAINNGQSIHRLWRQT